MKPVLRHKSKDLRPYIDRIESPEEPSTYQSGKMEELPKYLLTHTGPMEDLPGYFMTNGTFVHGDAEEQPSSFPELYDSGNTKNIAARVEPFNFKSLIPNLGIIEGVSHQRTNSTEPSHLVTNVFGFADTIQDKRTRNSYVALLTGQAPSKEIEKDYTASARQPGVQVINF